MRRVVAIGAAAALAAGCARGRLVRSGVVDPDGLAAIERSITAIRGHVLKRPVPAVVLDADGGLSPAESERLGKAFADDPTLQLERESMRSAWRELQSLGRSVAMRREVVDTALAATSQQLATTSARQPPKNRDSAPSPARRQRKPPQKR